MRTRSKKQFLGALQRSSGASDCTDHYAHAREHIWAVELFGLADGDSSAGRSACGAPHSCGCSSRACSSSRVFVQGGIPRRLHRRRVGEFTPQQSVWIVKENEQLFALIAVAPTSAARLAGCRSSRSSSAVPRSGFKANGINFEGPAPRPLERAKVSIADDGQILIDNPCSSAGRRATGATRFLHPV